MKETSTKQALLCALREAPGSWQSGGALAQKLGVSRNAVWKAANDLRAEGFDLQSVPRRGYLLQQGGDLLTSEELCVQLGAGWGAEAHASLPSTNQQARQLALDGQKGPFLVAAETQTAGRGRRGRTKNIACQQRGRDLGRAHRRRQCCRARSAGFAAELKIFKKSRDRYSQQAAPFAHLSKQWKLVCVRAKASCAIARAADPWR